MTFRFFSRTSQSPRRAAPRNPEQVMRAFWRTLEQIAPRSKGGGKPATVLVRDKP